MTPQELKNSILQLAIQGRLVSQRAEEGTAEELYNKIQAEKQNHIKTGKIKKEKTLPEITDNEKPFEIPQSWKWVRLGEVVYNHGQITPINKFSYVDIGSINNVKNSLNDDENIIDAKDAPSRARKIIELGDILYSTVRPYLHNMCIVNKKFKYQPIASTGFAVMACYFGLDNKFLFYYLLSPTFDNYANDSKNSKGVAYPAINDARLYNGIVPLPPLAEQKRIVAKIEELLPYVERYEKAYNELQQLNKRFPGDLQKSVLQLAIQGRLVSQCPEEGNAEDLYKQIQAEKQNLIKAGKIKKEKPLPTITDDEKPFEIPQSWKWVRLGEIGITQTGNTPSKANLEYFGTDIPFITPGDIANNNVNYNNQGLSNIGKNVARIGEKNTILQVCIGGSIGKSAIMDKIVAFNQQINSVYPIFIDCRYLHKVISSVYFITEMKEKAGGTATPIINRGIWNTLLVPLPPLAEQKRIVSKLEEILPLCDKLKQ